MTENIKVDLGRGKSKTNYTFFIARDGKYVSFSTENFKDAQKILTSQGENIMEELGDGTPLSDLKKKILEKYEANTAKNQEENVVGSILR